MKKITALFLSMILLLSMAMFTGCGDQAPAEEAQASSTGEAVDLYVLPDGCDLVPHEQFKEGFALLCDTSIDAAPVTMEVLEDTFGTEGYYYKNSDVIEEGMIYKTYGWFSDEDWMDGKVAVAVIFKAAEGTDDFSYYMYTSQGITFEDVQ